MGLLSVYMHVYFNKNIIQTIYIYIQHVLKHPFLCKPRVALHKLMQSVSVSGHVAVLYSVSSAEMQWFIHIWSLDWYITTYCT